MLVTPAPPRRRSSGPARRPSRRRWLVRLRGGALVTAFLLCALFDFGLSGPDSAAVRSFVGATARWQVNPEFRAVAFDYSARASEAMRIRPALVPARRVIMAIRSLPFLPKEFAVNPTSALHYARFSTGPLSAYLHLCSEQDMPDYLPLVEALGHKPNPTEADLRGFLDGFKMDFPVTKDAGAVHSVAALLQDADAARPFAVRVNIADLLAPDVSAVATELGVPTDPAKMTPDQQLAVLERLDGYVHRHDPELWRTKQVSDFCGGVWAQVFGPPYKILLVPALALHTVSRYAIVLLLLAVAATSARRRRPTNEPADEGSPGFSPAPLSSTSQADSYAGEPAGAGSGARGVGEVLNAKY